MKSSIADLTDAGPFAWGPRPADLGGEAPRTLARQTSLRLRRDIIRGVFKPGEKLTSARLSKAYDVGASPMREALFQVTSEGLIRWEEHKGFIVSPLTLGEMRDVSSLRLQLEIFAVRQTLAQGQGLEPWEAALLSAEYRLKKAEEAITQAGQAGGAEVVDEWESLHRDFHRTLCSRAGSPWLLHFFDSLYDHLERYRRAYWRYGERSADANHEHEGIVRAVLAHDADEVERLLTRHFQRQAEMTYATMQACAPPAAR